MCRKGENIRKRKDGRWEARYIKYRDPEGKIHYGSLYGKTYGEVKDKRNKKIAEVPGYGHLVRNPGILNYQATFETAAEHWKQEIRYTIKDSTFSNYEAILKNQLLPELGSTQIRKISNSQITQLIHKKKELALSAGTIHVILSVLRSILNFAAKGGVYTSEPIRYPHLAGTSQEVQIMKLANYNQLEKFLIDNISDFHFGLLLCMHTGIRVGDDDDKIRLNQRKPSKYKGLSRFGPEKNLQRINKFMKERPTFYKKLIQMKENFRFYLRCFYCITKVVILQFNSEKQDRISS